MSLDQNPISESKRMISHPLSREVVGASLKTAPPLTVWALTLNEWVAIATLCYVVLQAAYLIWKWRRETKAKALSVE
jgi:hypothetical protein